MIRGCVPKKLLVYGSRYGSDFADARGFGWSCEDLRFDWPTLIHNVRREVDRLNGVYARILENAGVDKFLTRAALESPHEIKLADRDQALSAKTILVATGGHPMIPEVPGKEHLISSNECFELEQLPASIAIIGAGYIGMEFASIFNGLGVAVTVLYRGDQILRDFDMELRDGLAEAMRNRGVDLRMNADIASIEKEGRGYRVHLTRGDSVAADLVMAATGRVPNTSGLGLQQAGRRTRLERPHGGRRILEKLGGQYLCRGRRDRAGQSDAGCRSMKRPRSPRRCSTTSRRRWITPSSRRRCFRSPRSARSGSRKRRRARCIAASISTRRGSGRSKPRSAAATRRC